MITKHKMQELQELAAERGPLCVGLDTDPSYLPDSVIKAVGSAEEAVLAYNKEIIRRIAADKSACCCKVQIAYYEAMGLKGMKVYDCRVITSIYQFSDCFIIRRNWNC